MINSIYKPVPAPRQSPSAIAAAIATYRAPYRRPPASAEFHPLISAEIQSFISRAARPVGIAEAKIACRNLGLPVTGTYSVKRNERDVITHCSHAFASTISIMVLEGSLVMRMHGFRNQRAQLILGPMSPWGDGR